MKEADTIRLVIVDDHPAVRLTLQVALQLSDGIAVVGEAADGEQALQVCSERHPDVVLMDLRMPRMDSAETIRALARQEPAPQVLVYTAEYDARPIQEALAAGACGYVLKQGDLTELLAALRAAHAGQRTAPEGP
jgi:DNA-binding NarL/FixJ family response regulator